MKSQRLVGIYSGEEYLPVRGISKGISYHILEERGRFLMERINIMIGVGIVGYPVGFFDSNWKGIYIYE